MRNFLNLDVSHLWACLRHRSNLPASNQTSIFLRGTLYTAGIYFIEYTSGTLLRHFHACPWDYSNSRCHYKGLIRLDYAPLWFCTGLFYEKVLNIGTNRESF